MPLLIVLLVGVVIALVGGSYYLKQKRKEGLVAFAAKHKFVYTPHAPPGLLAYSFPLFFRGDGRTADNGIHGLWKDMPFSGADFHCYDEFARDAQGHKGGRRYHHFSVAVADIPAWVPETKIHRENALSGLFDGVMGDDIAFESDSFNRTFRVSGADRKFAFELIDVRMMQWLLSCDPRFCFEVRNRAILVFSKRLEPQELLPLVGTLKEFHDRIPRMVLREYAYERPLES